MPAEFLRQNYTDALEDFHNARRKAVLEELLARITGKTSRMILYDEVRSRLGGVKSARKQLKDIPLDAIVGTVSRYKDFNRKLLPLSDNDSFRWAQVRHAVENQMGLPPIEVYQIGDVYFILDGHHRASVARDLGATHIQAYVREVYTKVPLSPLDQPDDIILKSEYADFLEKTHLDDLRPQADLRVTAPGEFEKLLEHISVHRYFLGIDEDRPISYPEAVAHWYDQVYRPIARIIEQRKILADFPGRSEADLYLWIMEYRSGLEQELGLKVSPTRAASDLISRHSPTFYHFLHRVAERLRKWVTPEPLEPSPPPGEWRRKRETLRIEERTGLFDSILVAVSGDPNGWRAVDLAAQIAQNENALLGGLHLLREGSGEIVDHINREFHARCQDYQIEGSLVIETGDITRSIYQKSFWADLLVLRLAYPPPFLSFRRFGSGLRNLIRLCRTPMILVPPTANPSFKRILLAYGGGPKADEALYIAAYLAQRWKTELVIVSVSRRGTGNQVLASRAIGYLKKQNVTPLDTVFETGDPASAILKHCTEKSCDLILMGGYEGGPIREMILGSTVDRVLWGTCVSVMICS